MQLCWSGQKETKKDAGLICDRVLIFPPCFATFENRGPDWWHLSRLTKRIQVQIREETNQFCLPMKSSGNKNKSSRILGKNNAKPISAPWLHTSFSIYLPWKKKMKPRFQMLASEKKMPSTYFFFPRSVSNKMISGQIKMMCPTFFRREEEDVCRWSSCSEKE